MRFFFLLTILFFFSCTTAQKAVEKKVVTNTSPNTYFKPLKYRNIGPFRGGRSVTASGVTGDPMTYYMGITGGGLWKTEDAGMHWRNISDGYFKTGSVGAVAVSESNPNIVYCGMGEHAPRGVMTHHGDGVYKSIDAGKTWTKIGLDKTQHIARIIIHPENPDEVYVAAQGALYSQSEERGIYKTMDGGKTWDKVLFVNNGTGCSELSMDKSQPNILYAAMWEHQRLPWKVISGGPGSGMYKSTDSGKTWKKIHNGLPEEKGKMAVSVCQSNPNKLYALVESDSDQEKGGLFVSMNAGGSWKRISKDHRLVQRAWYYTEVFADPQNENMVYVLSAPCLRSSDGGKTWERIRGTHGDYHDLWINPSNPKNLCIANDGGAAISFNRGKTWSRQDNMPTAQFYRVNVDNGFPYKIYGGQQDNTSVVIASRQLHGRSIDQRSWTYSAGGESAFLAFDPDHPLYVLGGSYLGTIEVLDTKAEAGTNIMAAPIQYLARDAKDMKYRYNWNAPIIWSQYENDNEYHATYYHAAQYLLRTDDLGVTWKEVSPDLTRNEKDKQGKGGGPYTNEAVGAENYGTISYVKESPHEEGVIWVGTDDGLVQLTKDGGKNWTNVTPSGLKECLVNAIDVSPHDASTAYIATTRYKFNDHTPAIYKTSNYGKTWTNISKGIPYGAFTRVVREDTQQKGLLFAGTETGVYASWNDGQSWQALQLNLPVTPINDLIVKHDDLIIATSGRSFWILDDLGVLRQFNNQKTDFQLFQPEDAIIGNFGSPLNGNSSTGTNSLVGVNPANGIVLYYNLATTKKGEPIELTITNASGKLVNQYTSKKDSTFTSWAGGPSAASLLSKKKGLNRFVWNMHHQTMKGIPGAYIEGGYSGHKAIPGTYTFTLKQGDNTQTTTAQILPNPNYSVTPKRYQAYSDLMSEMEAKFTDMHNQVNQLHTYQKQLKDIIQKLPAGEKYLSLKGKGEELLKEITAWDEEMVQRKSKAYDDVENFPNGFTANYLFLINQTESAIPQINQSSLDRKKELDAKWMRLEQQAQRLMKTDIPAMNKELWAAGIGALWSK